jgi:hypothetical protein
MDDFTLDSPEAAIAKEVQMVLEPGERIGLHQNTSKCEIIHPPELVISSFIHTCPQNADLLGAPLFEGNILDSALQNCCDNLTTAIDRLKTVSSHDALISLRSCLGAPKIQHLLRCSPCFDNQLLVVFDELLCTGVSAITNCDLSDSQWMQASLPYS